MSTQTTAGTGAHIAIADDASVFDLPDGDWAVSFWMRSEANDNNHLYLFGWGAFAATPSINCYLQSGVGNLRMYTKDDDGTIVQFYTTTDLRDSAWHHILYQRGGGVLAGYVDGSSENSASTASYDTVTVTGDWVVNNNGAKASDKSFPGSIADFAKWDRALSAEEIASLADGFSAAFFSPTWHAPLIRDLVEVRENLGVTGSSNTIADHPPLLFPTRSIVGIGAGAAPPAGGFFARRYYDQFLSGGPR